ncbi:MAG TPA: G1 family glutamic endopeptidase, partial [Streptosporangiaceae bacterium]|nr:G1 family glutamic endopeptidase [Streptosporangiaceae bacterium]
MLRRWCIVLVMLAAAAGTALTASSASAAPAGEWHFSPGGTAHLVGHGTSAGGLRHQAESTNWSGYAATTGTYTSVSASWVQPAGVCSRGDQYAAFWVGLDGYSSSTVEQTGSEVDCVGRTAEYYAWYEMYPGPSENYSNKVWAGDQFNASVTYMGSNEFSLFIADTTQGWKHTITASLAGAARSPAEVIVEAPCCTFSGGILPLADFGTMGFSAPDANGSDMGNAGGVTQITMVDNRGLDKDSISSLSGGTGFSATWLRSS